MDKREYQKKEEKLSQEIYQKKVALERAEDERFLTQQIKSEVEDSHLEAMMTFEELGNRFFSAETELYILDLKQEEQIQQDKFQDLMAERLVKENRLRDNLEDELGYLQRRHQRLDDDYRKSQGQEKNPWFDFNNF